MSGPGGVADQMLWRLVPAPPVASTRVVYRGPQGLDSSTPEELRALYARESQHGELALWLLGDFFGVKAGIDERVVRQVPGMRWRMSFVRPGRTRGRLDLDVCRPDGSEEQILLSDRYGDREHVWFRQVVAVMRSVFGFEVEILDLESE